ncbi:MAG: hypothetical protein AMXMBFR4_00530 [Candidatus Hydrogenedentota bacterium]
MNLTTHSIDASLLVPGLPEIAPGATVTNATARREVNDLTPQVSPMGPDGAATARNGATRSPGYVTTLRE